MQQRPFDAECEYRCKIKLNFSGAQLPRSEVMQKPPGMHVPEGEQWSNNWVAVVDRTSR